MSELIPMNGKLAESVIRSLVETIDDHEAEYVLTQVANWIAQQPECLTEKQWQIVHELREASAGYLSSWHIAEMLEIGHSEIAEGTYPEGAYRKAVLELIAQGIIEEVPNMGSWYRLVQEPAPQTGPLSVA